MKRQKQSRTVGDKVREIVAARNEAAGLPNDPQGRCELPVPFEAPLDKPPTASILGITVSGLDKLISTGKAPPFFRVGRRIRWRPSVLMAWLAEQEERAASEATKTTTTPT
jgi:predicted DNA-binding transcriptional regulator AlpA